MEQESNNSDRQSNTSKTYNYNQDTSRQNKNDT